MTVTKRTGLLFALAVLACLLVAPAALAEVRSGSATDPAGDFPGGPPHQDLTAAEVSYDTAGTLNAKVTMAAAPDAAKPAIARVVVGNASSVGCLGSLFVTVTAPSGPAEASVEGFKFNAPTLSQAGNVLSIQATDGRLATLPPPDCALVVGGNPPDQYGDDIANIPLKAAAPAPAPPPPATKPPATTKPKPSAKLRKALRSCQRKHKGSKPSKKRARKRCIARARKKYGPKT